MRLVLILCALLGRHWFPLRDEGDTPNPPAPVRQCRDDCKCKIDDCKCGTKSGKTCAAEPQARRVQWLMFSFVGCVQCDAAKANLRPWLEASKWEVSPSPTAHVRLIDAELDPEIASSFRVQEFPTFILVVDGVETKRYQGYPGRERLVNEYLSASRKAQQ